MYVYSDWDLPGLDYFQFGNAYKGSREDLRFLIRAREEKLAVITWFGEKCFELAENKRETEFDIAEHSLRDICEYLSKLLKEHNNEKKERQA